MTTLETIQAARALQDHRKKTHDPDEHNQFQDMIMMANDGIMVIQENKLAVVNRALLLMLGYDDADDLLGASVDTILDTTIAHFYEEGQESLHWGDLQNPSFRACLLMNNGTILNVEISTSYFAYDGLPATLGIVRDITSQIELEEAIDLSESRYRALFDSSPIAYFTLSMSGNILQINKAVERLLGYSEDDILRHNLASFIFGNDKNEIVREVISEVAQGKSVDDFEMQFQKADGRPIWANVKANLLEYPDKSSTIALMAMDIDRRKSAEAREHNERDRANLYLEVFTHDLNNINQSLLFSLGLVENLDTLPERVKSMMQQSSWHIRRSGRMTANMRALLRLRETPPTVEEVDLHDYIQVAKFAVQEDFPWKQLSLTTNIKKGEFLVAGHEYLHQVCFNIIHNSMAFDEKEVVEVEVIAEQVDNLKMVRLEFLDKGPGVPDTTKEFIFRRTGSPDDQIVGRGLGLTLVDQIVRSLGGRIKVEDRVVEEPSQGAKFVIMLPMWVEVEELPCGRNTCITFYKSNHCVFCDPAMETLLSVLKELGVPPSIIETINVDNPTAEVKHSELPMLPFIKICETKLTGFISDESIRSAVLNLAMKNCYPDFL
ncbi:PAS domain S-box protein [Candidatus Thorarchaeota archaeon]|nr:MAG: PAS domain S-box protein [Candidatus Thorarchaeota archaeon]